MVLYRKYRPQKLSELDIKEVREKLIKTLLSSYKPHAYLFSGPRGTGKTSSARIVAKALNCENLQSDGEPCNKCEACLSITEGRNLDVIEIDAASNRGIDEIRDLREKIRLAPSSLKYKVYIIDEVHMLTNDAFNALLKTLEEPPKHAIFILATTEPGKLPETILSRTSQFAFHKATDGEVVSALERVIKGENLKIEKQVLEVIASASDGSFRDATKILESALSQNAATSDDITKFLGFDAISSEKFLILLKNKEVKLLLEAIVLMGEKGVDFRSFITSVLNTLHLVFLHLHGVEQKNISEELKNSLTKKEVRGLIDLLSKVYADLKFASRPELPIETAVVEWCSNRKEV